MKSPDQLELQEQAAERPARKSFHPLRNKLFTIAVAAGGLALLAACGQTPAISAVDRINNIPCATEDLRGAQGGFVLFPKRVGGDQETNIYILNYGGGSEVPRTVQNLTNSSHAHEVDPAFSPDGQEVVYVQYPTWKPKGEKDIENIWSGDEGIYIIGVDGSNRQKLVTTPPQSFDSIPVFSQDRELIAFTRQTVPAPRMGYMDVYVVDRSGQNLRNLTHTKPPTRGAFGEEPKQEYIGASLTIAPDKKYVAFIKDGAAHVVDTYGQVVSRLTASGGYGTPSGEDTSVLWIDGSMLQIINQFRGSRGIQDRTILTRVDGHGLIDITNHCPPGRRFNLSRNRN